MNIVLDASAGNGTFGETATAGTAIVVPIPPVVNHYTRLLQLNYTPSGTSHNISVLKPVGTATVNGAQSASAATMVLSAAPVSVNPSAVTQTVTPQNSDWVVWKQDDGTFVGKQLASSSAWNSTTLTLTFAANLPKALTGNEPIWIMGAATGTNSTEPYSGTTQTQIATATATTLSMSDGTVGITSTYGQNHPILIVSPNGSNAGTFGSVTWAYTLRGPGGYAG